MNICHNIVKILRRSVAIMSSQFYLHLITSAVIILFAVRNLTVHAVKHACGPGWTVYRDEKCFLMSEFPNSFLNYENAKAFCKDVDKDATLPCIRTEEEQIFLMNLINKKQSNASIWLGARSFNGTFEWEDNTQFEYTSWSKARELNQDCATIGVDLANPEGHWQTESCSNQNLVVCQTHQAWSSLKLRNLIQALSGELLLVKGQISSSKAEDSEARLEISVLKKEIGDIRVELESTKADLLNAEQRISQLQAAVNASGFLEQSLVKEITLMKQNISTFKADVHDAKNSFAELTKQITNITSEISLSQTNAVILNNSILTTNTSLAAVSRKLDILDAQFAAEKTSVQTDITSMKSDIQRNKMPAIGFIYVQYSGQAAPSTLWPGATWTDVTSTYSGLFFRAAGGNAKPFGQIQTDFAPRITSVYFSNAAAHKHSSTVSLNVGSISEAITAGGYDGAWTGLKFYTSSGEVRPKNQAILIFKRVA